MLYVVSGCLIHSLAFSGFILASQNPWSSYLLSFNMLHRREEYNLKRETERKGCPVDFLQMHY